MDDNRWPAPRHELRDRIQCAQYSGVRHQAPNVETSVVRYRGVVLAYLVSLLSGMILPQIETQQEGDK
jgi:hypothetical protein